MAFAALPAQASVQVGAGTTRTSTDWYIDVWVNNSGTINTYGYTTVRLNDWNAFWGDATNLIINSGGVWNNFGTLDLLSSGTYKAGNAWIKNSGTFNNKSGATLLIQSESWVENYGNGVINNEGTIDNRWVISSSGIITNKSGATLRNSGTFTNTGTFELAAGSSYDFTGGTLINNGTFLVGASFTFGFATAGTVNLNAGGTLKVSGSVFFPGSGYGPFTNSGTITNLSDGRIDITGTLTHAAGAGFSNAGVIDVSLNGYLANESTITNSGILQVRNNGLVELRNGSTFTNTGSLAATGTLKIGSTAVLDNSNSIYAGSTFGNQVGTIENHGTFNNSGEVKVVGRGTLELWGDSGGRSTFNNTGLLQISSIISGASYGLTTLGGILNNNSGGTISFEAGSTYTLDLVTLNNNSGATLTFRRNFEFGDHETASGVVNLNAGGTVQNYAVLSVAPDCTFTNRGTLHNNAGGTVRLDAGTAYAFSGATFYNHAGATLELRRDFVFGASAAGTLILESGGTVQNYALLTTATGRTLTNAGTLNNNSGGTLRLDAGTAYNFTGGILNNNSGANFELRQDFSFGTAAAGTINLNAGGTLTNREVLGLPVGATQGNAGTLTNYGAVSVAGTLNTSGTFTNHGHLVLSGTLNATGTLSLLSGSTFNFTGGTLNLNAASSLVLGRSFTFGGDTAGTVNLNAGSTVDNQATLTIPAGHTQTNAGTINNYSSLTVAGTLASTGALLLHAGSTYDFTGGTLTFGTGGTLALGLDFTLGQAKAGTINLGSGSRLASYATLSLPAGNSHTHAGLLDNYGTFALAGTLTQPAGSTLRNFGTLDVNSGGTLVLESGSQFVLASGTLNLNSGGCLITQTNLTLETTSLLTLKTGGTLENRAAMNLREFTNNGNLVNGSGGQLSFTGAEWWSTALLNTTGATLTNESGATITSQARIENQAGATIHNAAGGTFSAQGYVLNYGTIRNSGTAVVSGNYEAIPGSTLINDAGASLTLAGNASFDPVATFQNAGTLTITPGVNAYLGSLRNTGTVEGTGLLFFDGSLENAAGGTFNTSCLLQSIVPATNAGTFNNRFDATLNPSWQTMFLGGFTNTGTVNNYAGAWFCNGGSFLNTGTFVGKNASGTVGNFGIFLQYNDGTSTNRGVFTQQDLRIETGTFTHQAGTFDVTNVTVSGGRLVFAAPTPATIQSLTLAGGRLTLDTAVNQTFGGLTLSPGTASTIDFGSTSSQLLFTTGTFGSGSTLCITGFDFQSGARLVIPNLSTDCLAGITINSLPAIWVSSAGAGSLTAVPEPATYAAAAGLLALAAASRRRRRS